MKASPERLERADIQGIVVSAYRHLPFANYILLRVDPNQSAAARRWLAETVAAQVTRATGKGSRTSLNFALTRSGLENIGLRSWRLESFSAPFFDGMHSPRRAKILGDTPDEWNWGNAQNPVDVLLMTFAEDANSLDGLARSLVSSASAIGISLVDRLSAQIPEDHREHFGFLDGVATPVLEGLLKPGVVPRPGQVVKNGEFVLGYTNGYGFPSEMPALGWQKELGRNGTYLAFRQTCQNVAAFRDFLVKTAATPAARQRLAAQMVGRWENGAPLVLAGSPQDPNYAAFAGSDDFGFAREDPQGLKCPFGAHIRRCNPRDALLNNNPDESLEFVARHRLLRRGRLYGPPFDSDPKADRGLQFIALCADLGRQFEFLQQTWINNPAFNDLDEADPIVGKPVARTFTIQEKPVRRRIRGLKSFVTTRGGAYFFVPSIKALRWFGEYDPQNDPQPRKKAS